MTGSRNVENWLRGYASDLYDWQTALSEGRKAYWRRLGMVEGMFDTDGTAFEGRADLNMNQHIEVRTLLNAGAFRKRLRKAWAVFRQKHVLLATAAVNIGDIDSKLPQPRERAFLFRPSADASQLFRDGDNHLVFIGDHYSVIDADDFYEHIINTARAINAKEALSRLHILPYQHSTTSAFTIHFMLITGHQITDGLTTFHWMNTFVDILNLSDTKLDHLAAQLCSHSPSSRLPAAQETLYPPIYGNTARQRWFWAITRILRHTRILPPPSFPNPLYRTRPLSYPTDLLPRYSKVLDYSRAPPTKCHHVSATLSPRSTAQLRNLCRQAKISIGSGLFALVGIVMMQLYEKAQPDIRLEDRLPFTGSFPMNPRPFLTMNPVPDSCILGFSDGISLPFLPSSLPLSGRLRLLGKIAHRQLKIYQKRQSTPAEEAALGAKSGNQLLPVLYASTADRLEQRRQAEDKLGWNVQGAYPAKQPKTWGTCGVSSVGERSGMIKMGRYDVNQRLDEGSDVDTIVDFRDISSTVRARDGEFLVGVIGVGEKGVVQFGVSYDAGMVDSEKVKQWKELVEGILESDIEDEQGPTQARL